MGDMLIIPVRYSMKVPRLMGMSISDKYFRQKLMNLFSFYSERYSFIDCKLVKYLLDGRFVMFTCMQ